MAYSNGIWLGHMYPNWRHHLWMMESGLGEASPFLGPMKTDWRNSPAILPWKWPIYGRLAYSNWWVSIALLAYQRAVFCHFQVGVLLEFSQIDDINGGIETPKKDAETCFQDFNQMISTSNERSLSRCLFFGVRYASHLLGSHAPFWWEILLIIQYEGTKAGLFIGWQR